MKLLFETEIKETGGKVAWLKSPGTKQILELDWYPKSFKFGGRTDSRSAWLSRWMMRGGVLRNCQRETEDR